MDTVATAAKIQALAARCLRSGDIVDTLAADQGNIEPPLLITDVRGSPDSWFVPITVADRLIGYLHFGVDGTFRRYTSFPSHGAGLTGYPTARVWLDPQAVLATAQAKAPASAKLAPPVLSYDAHPDRIAWRVDAVDPAGNVSTIYVAGQFAYRAPPPDEEQVTGER